jgi:predicted transposase YdaD
MLMSEWKLEDALVVEREEGWEEGREKERGEAVKKLLAYGMSPEQVSQALQLPPDTVKQYLN